MVENIKSYTDIIQTAEGLGLKIVKTGRYYKTTCLFHKDNNPSMFLFPETGTYHCFSCSAHGDIISLVQKVKNCDFIEACKYLCNEYNIDFEIKEKDDNHDKLQPFYEINTAAAQFFKSNLKNEALQYALKRFKKETVELWQIGAAPNDWNELYKHLKAQGYNDELLLKSGLVKKSEKGKLYDAFRNRLMFPICDTRGRVIAFSGRDLTNEPNIAKYINSQETPIYKKSTVLMGFNRALKAIRKYNVCIIVEGNADVIHLHEIGINNVVAGCGVSLSEEQITAISRITNNIALLYDSDEAGQRAVIRSSELICKANLTPIILTIPNDENGNKQDPDTFFNNKEQFRTFYNSFKKTYYEYLTEQKAENCVNDPVYTSSAVKSIARLFYRKNNNEITAIVESLSKTIPTKTIWNSAIKDLITEDKQHEKQQAADERTTTQNDTFAKYGFYEKDKCYWFQTLKGEGVYKGSNFILIPLFHIESTFNAKRLYKITNTYGVERVIEFPQKDLISLQSFKLRCESLGNFLFDGGEGGLSKIKQFLYEKTESCKEVTQLGWQTDGFFAWANGISTKEGFLQISKNGICKYNEQNYYIPALSSFYENDDKLFEFERKFKYIESKTTLNEWFLLFKNVYKVNAIPAVGFYFATLFKDFIKRKEGFFPLFNIFGVKGSGKSEMAQSLLQLFGTLPKGLNLTTSTLPALADHIAQTANAVCHVDEYKNSVEYEKIEFLKGLWDGVGRNRMNMDKDKKKEMTAVDCGVVITGQEMPTADIALFSRVIFTKFTTVVFNDQEKQLFQQLKELEKKGLTVITSEILKQRSAFIENYDTIKNEVIAEIQEENNNKIQLDDRIFRNWTVILTSIKLGIRLFDLNLSWVEALKTCVKLIQEQQQETLKENETAQFWDIFMFFVQEGVFEQNYDFRIDLIADLQTEKTYYKRDVTQPFNVLAIDTTRVLQYYTKHCKQIGIKGLPKASIEFYLRNQPEFLGIKAFRVKKRTEHLQEKPLKVDFADVKIQTYTKRLWCFDLDKLGLPIQTNWDFENDL